MLRRLWMRAAAACAFASGHAASVVLRRAEVRPITDRRHDIELVEPYRWLEQQEARDVRRWIAAQNADVKPARYPGTMIRG